METTMTDTTNRTDKEIEGRLVLSCWYRDLSRTALIAMPTPTLVEFAAEIGLTVEEMIRAMQVVGQRCERQAQALKTYRTRTATHDPRLREGLAMKPAKPRRPLKTFGSNPRGIAHWSPPSESYAQPVQSTVGATMPTIAGAASSTVPSGGRRPARRCCATTRSAPGAGWRDASTPGYGRRPYSRPRGRRQRNRLSKPQGAVRAVPSRLTRHETGRRDAAEIPPARRRGSRSHERGDDRRPEGGRSPSARPVQSSAARVFRRFFSANFVSFRG